MGYFISLADLLQANSERESQSIFGIVEVDRKQFLEATDPIAERRDVNRECLRGGLVPAIAIDELRCGVVAFQTFLGQSP